MQTATAFSISPCGPLAPALPGATHFTGRSGSRAPGRSGRSGGGLAICYLENQYQKVVVRSYLSGFLSRLTMI